MRIWLLAGAIGIATASFSPILFPLWLAFAFIILSLLVLLGRFFISPLLSGLFFGLFWGVLAAHWTVGGMLAPSLEGKALWVQGYIADLPVFSQELQREKLQKRARFTFALETPKEESKDFVINVRRLRLSWYEPPVDLQPGQRWKFKVKLWQPRGFINPGGGDYAATLLGAGIGARGYVLNEKYGRSQRIPGVKWSTLHHRLRANLRVLIGKLWDGKNLPLINALMIGERSQLEENQRKALRQTGTAHLLAISGLHIGFVAVLAYNFFYYLSRIFPFPQQSLVRYFPAPWWGALGALVAAMMYAAFSGFALPARRALVMVGVAMICILFRRKISFSTGYCLALFLILLWEPLAAHSVGFWLSFTAAGALLLIFHRRSKRPGKFNFLRSFLYAQFAVTLGLLVPLGYFWQSIPLVSPLANLIAIPLVSFVVVPAALCSALFLSWFPWLGLLLLDISDLGIDLLFYFLNAVNQWPEILIWHPSSWGIPALICGICGVFGIFIATNRRQMLFCSILLLPLFFPSTPWRDVLRIVVLDVGQGLAVTMHTRNHNLVYDVGPQYGRLDSGTLVLVPALRNMGVELLDRVILSHGDQDHIGGLPGLCDNMPIVALQGAPVEDFPCYRGRLLRSVPCFSGQSWKWDGVHFTFLHPEKGRLINNRNNQSCVLLVEAAGRRILLTGDITKKVERKLVDYGKVFDIDVVFSGHHGSNTSSHNEFVKATNPKYVIHSAGWKNHYGHPAKKVTALWAKAGAVQLNTANEGAISFAISEKGEISAPRVWREGKKRFWDARQK